MYKDNNEYKDFIRVFHESADPRRDLYGRVVEYCEDNEKGVGGGLMRILCE